MNRTHGSTLLVAGLLALNACGGGPEVASTPTSDPVAVNLVALGGTGNATLHPVRVVAAREAEVSTRLSGTLDMVAPLGAQVAAGEVVARLTDEDVRAAVQRAEARAELAVRTADRIRNLAAAGAASAQELDQAVAAESEANAAVAEARAQLGYVDLTSPVAGRVTARMMEAGDLATPGRPVVRIASAGRELRGELPAETAGRIEVGSVLRVEGSEDEVRVVRISPALEASTRRFTVELQAPASMRLGEVARIAVPAAEATGITVVPGEAIVRRGQLTGVFTVQADTLRLRWIRLGREVDGGFELLSGPVGITEVVMNPAGASDGAPAGTVTRVSAPSTGAGG